jgi:hypothetical protein
MNVRPMGNITLYFFLFRLTGLLIVFYCLVLFIKYVFSLLVSEGVIIDSRTDPRSRISLPRLIIIFIINQGQ